MRFSSKTILITGGSSGIGFATAKRIIDEGGSVIITGRNQESLDFAVENLGKKARSFASDASRLSDIEALFIFIKKEIGSINGLFANAGAAVLKPVDEVTEEDFDMLINVNVKSVFFTLQKAIPYLTDEASIVLNASVAGCIGSPIGSVYGAAKAAVRSMARTFASSLIERKIRVNAVSPGPIKTPLWHKDKIVTSIIEEVTANNPMRRFGTPEETAAAVTFLLAPESSYITGIELFVDGGLTQL
ncbi:putative oxidoreductase YkvO [Legionella antarctica]|uniref:Putative oxidoreductase YkvO n=1 Tax=Legionella antarctica TaxID=2708020 RepID=A0A6F8T5S2_9GAMM|nr:SDR family oxidoreductase [Legionella antarctica]BCA95382.1 putative oxidoreductase YkvO [Legionella antarctica]